MALAFDTGTAALEGRSCPRRVRYWPAVRGPGPPAQQALWKIGDYTALVVHATVGPEIDLCDTNKVMRGQPHEFTAGRV